MCHEQILTEERHQYNLMVEEHRMGRQTFKDTMDRSTQVMLSAVEALKSWVILKRWGNRLSKHQSHFILLWRAGGIEKLLTSVHVWDKRGPTRTCKENEVLCKKKGGKRKEKRW